MSLHPSLRQSGGKMGTLRNVLKRHERLRDLLAHDRFVDGASVYGLPKTKQIRLKVRKAAKEAVPGAEGAKTAEGATPAPAAAAGKAAPATGGGKSPAGGKSAGKPA